MGGAVETVSSALFNCHPPVVLLYMTGNNLDYPPNFLPRYSYSTSGDAICVLAAFVVLTYRCLLD